ncbi:MAG: YbbR-like domain-containing protein [Prevotella sp.]|jgi:hypothetical protein|uniref:YbbR-like domain-containing protein n=2 Tax=Segatella cerevisiae TaxID=2053716 RepID=A0ABT1BTY0_9BACT|nr:YbbR-like domain-containing protein [Prevotella sp.]MCH3995558.1 YbbR-like domain-containing protein [Prevotella sp.]MCI1245972.1 YbbR-like domain-containing protein [Prevotella sp.]MCO6024424.1 YbbR-like domain-containing protein [Segatella cerevisiae]
MHNASHILQLVRDFLLGLPKRIISKEFLIFLFFLALSAIFWLLMSLNGTYEKEYPVALRLTGVPRNAVITGPLEDTVYVTIRDKGFQLLAYSTSKSIQPVSVPFSAYAQKDTGHGNVPIGDIKASIYLQLFKSSKITQFKPGKLDFYFNFGLSKVVPVRMAGTVVPGESYYLSKVEFWPEKVTVYANRHLLDKVHSVSTENLYITNFSDTLYRMVSLKSIRGVKIVPNRVQIGLFPDILTEESVEVPITAINMPAGKVLRTFPSKVKVSFIIGASMFRTIHVSQFSVVANYKELASDSTKNCKLHLKMFPHGIMKPHLDVNQVDYLIEENE